VSCFLCRLIGSEGLVVLPPGLDIGHVLDEGLIAASSVSLE